MIINIGDTFIKMEEIKDSLKYYREKLEASFFLEYRRTDDIILL